MSIAVKVAPVTGIFVAMIVFNNLCLQYVEVSFYQVRACVRMLAATLDHHTHAHAHAYASNVQVARAWTTILTIAFAYFLLNESTSVRVRTSLAPRMHSCNRSNQRTERTNSLDSTGPHCLWSSRGGIRAGKLGRGESLVDRCDVRHGVEHLRGAVQHLRQEGWMAINGTADAYSPTSISPRFAPFRFVSCLLTRCSLADHRYRMLLIYNTILALIVLIPLIAASGEIPLIMEQPNATDGNTWFLIILAGVLGFAINIVVYLLLKLTSPLTHNITGQLKGAVQTILAFYLFQNPVTIMVRSASVAQRTPALPPRDTNTLGTVALDVECCRHRPHHRRLDDVLVCSLPRDEVTLVRQPSIYFYFYLHRCCHHRLHHYVNYHCRFHRRHRRPIQQRNG